MPELDMLNETVVRRTPIGIGYVLMSDVPEPWRALCWKFVRERRGALILPDGSQASFVEDWREWLNSLSATEVKQS